MAERGEIVKALLAEMRAVLLSATPETREDCNARLVMYSGILATFTPEQSQPFDWHMV